VYPVGRAQPTNAKIRSVIMHPIRPLVVPIASSVIKTSRSDLIGII
jgi:hypothetical protein